MSSKERRKGPTHKMVKEMAKKIGGDGTGLSLRYKGVPSKYLLSTYDDIGKVFGFTMPRPWAKDGMLKNYRTKNQNRAIKGIFEDTALADSSSVVAVGSYPTDHLGMIFGAAVCRRALEMELNPLMLNLTNFPSRTEIKETPDVVVLHNVNPDSHKSRIEVCRDWITIFDDTFIVVIVGGSDPATFFHMKLHYSFDTALYFQGE